MFPRFASEGGTAAGYSPIRPNLSVARPCTGLWIRTVLVPTCMFCFPSATGQHRRAALYSSTIASPFALSGKHDVHRRVGIQLDHRTATRSSAGPLPPFAHVLPHAGGVSPLHFSPSPNNQRAAVTTQHLRQRALSSSSGVLCKCKPARYRGQRAATIDQRRAVPSAHPIHPIHPIPSYPLPSLSFRPQSRASKQSSASSKQQASKVSTIRTRHETT